MSQLLAASIGSYPRTGEDKDQQRYPRALGHFERKEISAHALRDVRQSVAQEIVREQLDAGVDEATDGLISWPDPISQFTRHLSATRLGGLDRYFDNNFYYRVPVITGKPKIGPAVSAEDYHFARGVSNKPVRAVVTGPVTLALHTRSTVKPYDKLAARVDFFTEVIAQEIAALAAENAAVIQIDEPSLTVRPDQMPLFEAAAEDLAEEKGKSKLAVSLYFGSAAPLLDSLKNLPFDVWHIDVVSDPSLLEKLGSAPSTTAVGVGILNGRSTLLEEVESTAGVVGAWLAKRGASTNYLSPSCGLEFLPRKAAAAKLHRLAEIRHHLGGIAVGAPRA